MRSESPTRAELHEVFAFILAKIRSGEYKECPTDTGLGDTIVEALDAIPTAVEREAAIKQAWTIFEREHGQLLIDQPPAERSRIDFAIDDFLCDPLIRWAEQRYNQCHEPDSGRFCSGSGAGGGVTPSSGTVGSIGPIAPG